MTIEQTNIIDVTGISKEGEIVLTISDHLEWSDCDSSDHLNMLQDKINTYLSFIESGQIEEEYPNGMERKIVIEVLGKYDLNSEAQAFYAKASPIVRDAGFDLQFSLYKEDGDGIDDEIEA